jgi:four helix bundle protein
VYGRGCRVEGRGGKVKGIKMGNDEKKGSGIKSYKDLIVYQKSYKLAIEIYKVTRTYPQEELYGTVSQMRRSAVSISCNIAEGYRRGHRKEYLQFLYIAYGSCSELETLLSLSCDLGFIEKGNFDMLYQLQVETSRLLKGLIQSLSKYPR